MQIVLLGFLDLPHIALIAGAAPVVIGAIAPAIENRLVLTLVIGASQGEGILGPDDEGRPLAAG